MHDYDDDSIEQQPAIVFWLRGYMFLMILAGIGCIVGAVVLALQHRSLGGSDPDDDLFVIASLICAGGVFTSIAHAFPVFLKRSPTAHRWTHRVLLFSIILWGLACWVFVFPAAILLSQWSKEEVKIWYGVTARRRRGHEIDPGWDEDWK